MVKLSKEQIEKLKKNQKPLLKLWEKDEKDFIYYLNEGLTVRTIFEEKLFEGRSYSSLKNKMNKLRIEGKLNEE